MHRRRHLGWGCAALALGALAAPCPAPAAVVSMERVHGFSDGVYFEREVTLAAPADEVNRVTVRLRIPEGGRTGSIHFSDAGGRLRAGAGCRRAPGGVSCSSAIDPIEKLYVDAGPGDDVVRLVAAAHFGPVVRVRAGAGDDTVRGSQMKEEILGGPGADVLHGGPPSTDRDDLNGGPGRDRLRTGDGDRLEDGERDGQASSDVYVGDGDSRLSYESRRLPVTVDLAARTGGGGAGERDRIIGVGGIEGGAGGDRIAGRGGREFFRGGAGEDLLLGRAGSDILYGGLGADRIDGGSGRDAHQTSRDGATDTHACGPDFDQVEGQDPADLLSPDCERAGWGSTQDLMAVQPVFEGNTARFSASCFRSSPCPGTIELRTRPENELVGHGSFRFTREGRMEAVLDRDPAVLFAPPGRLVRVRVTYDTGCGICPVVTGFTTTFRR